MWLFLDHSQIGCLVIGYYVVCSVIWPVSILSSPRKHSEMRSNSKNANQIWESGECETESIDEGKKYSLLNNSIRILKLKKKTLLLYKLELVRLLFIWLYLSRKNLIEIMGSSHRILLFKIFPFSEMPEPQPWGTSHCRWTSHSSLPQCCRRRKWNLGRCWLCWTS